jgi:serine/threonine protein kinase
MSDPDKPAKQHESLEDIELPPLPGPAWPVVAGYEILGELGSGGLGTVYKAKQIQPDRVVALKVMRAESVPPDQLARFQEEARAIARLNHPSLVPIYEIGERQPLPGGPAIPFLVSEFVAGGSLAGRLGRGPIAWPEAAQMMEQLARAMQFCHDRDIVHGNLKPANVLLGADDQPRVTDFALADKTERGQRRVLAGIVPATLAYLAPEQATGKKAVGPAADVYALGAILYHTLSGQPPFSGKTPRETLAKVVRESPPALRDLKVDVPRELEALTLRCLAKSPGARPATAVQLAEELRRVIDGFSSVG